MDQRIELCETRNKQCLAEQNRIANPLSLAVGEPASDTATTEDIGQYSTSMNLEMSDFLF